MPWFPFWMDFFFAFAHLMSLFLVWLCVLSGWLRKGVCTCLVYLIPVWYLNGICQPHFKELTMPAAKGHGLTVHEQAPCWEESRHQTELCKAGSWVASVRTFARDCTAVTGGRVRENIAMVWICPPSQVVESVMSQEGSVCSKEWMLLLSRRGKKALHRCEPRLYTEKCKKSLSALPESWSFKHSVTAAAAVN